MSRRPATHYTAGRRSTGLPHEIVQDDRHDSADQDEHRAKDADPMGAVLPVRAGVLLRAGHKGSAFQVKAGVALRP